MSIPCNHGSIRDRDTVTLDSSCMLYMECIHADILVDVYDTALCDDDGTCV